MNLTCKGALALLSDPHRRTNLGKAVAEVLNAADPRLADLATRGGDLLAGENVDTILAAMAAALRPMKWARPEYLAGAACRPFVDDEGKFKCLGVWTVEEAAELRRLDEAVDAAEATVNVTRGQSYARVTSALEEAKKATEAVASYWRPLREQMWPRFLERVQAAWRAAAPKVAEQSPPRAPSPRMQQLRKMIDSIDQKDLFASRLDSCKRSAPNGGAS